jgi:hypothetical protein
LFSSSCCCFPCRPNALFFNWSFISSARFFTPLLSSLCCYY